MFSAAHEAATSAVEKAFASAKADNAVEPHADADGWTQVGSLKVKGGEYGKDYIYTADTMQFHGADYTVAGAPLTNVVEVLTSEPLTFQDADPFNIDNVANAGTYSTTAIVVRE